MADLINFTLPTIKTEDNDDRTMKQIKNYLFQLTEQMRFYLNNIDSDNYTEDYRERMSRMIDTTTENEHELTVAQKAYKEMNERLKTSIIDSVQLISGNKGGYVVLDDANDDGYPDEILIMDTMSKETAQSLWRWNHSGLMFTNGGYNSYPFLGTKKENIEYQGHIYEDVDVTYSLFFDTDEREEKILKEYALEYDGSIEIFEEELEISDVAAGATLAIDMYGNINANCITAGTINAVDINGVDITGCTITGNTIRGNVIEATEGYIAGWELSATKLSTASGYLEEVDVNNDVYEINLNKYISSVGITGSVFEVIRNYIDPDDPYSYYSDTVFRIAYDGSITATRGNIGGLELGETYLRSIGEDGQYRYYCDIRSWDYDSTNAYAFAIYYNEIGTNNWSAPFNVSYDGTVNATKLNATGIINATGGRIGVWEIDGLQLSAEANGYKAYIQKPYQNASTTYAKSWVFSAQQYNNGWSANFFVQADGFVHMNYADCDSRLDCNKDLRVYRDLYLFNKNAGTLTVDSNGLVGVHQSSKRFKENITTVIPVEYNPTSLYKLPVKMFNFKKEFADNVIKDDTQIGLIAEDVEKYYPNAVLYDNEGRVANWNERILIPAMLKLIQEQHEEIEALKNYVYKKGA